VSAQTARPTTNKHHKFGGGEGSTGDLRSFARGLDGSTSKMNIPGDAMKSDIPTIKNILLLDGRVRAQGSQTALRTGTPARVHYVQTVR
jgi:hypothetical protein